MGKAIARTDPFNAPIQKMLVEHIWEDVWSRPELSPKLRSIVVVSLLIALDKPDELALHLRAALGNGCSIEELREVMIQAIAYCGAPTALAAIRVANSVLQSEIAAMPDPSRQRGDDGS
ncbi:MULTISPECIES: carboxymuconolactone decarboxylase family protein [Xanthobacter]|uniref:carboxymuconolactone decarboxylase family protein n=1 Tax=Xanthobacter TaxID=279 RepID=UPI003726EAE8